MSASPPPLFLIGAAKAGTTTLARRLGALPAFRLSDPKEPEFFSHDANFAQGLARYAECFAGARPDQVLLDASTAYTRSPQHPLAAGRIHAHRPDARLVYLLRHPVDRAYSHFVHRHTKELHPGRDFDRDFEAHVATDPMCVDSSDYHLQIQAYLAHFPREALLVLFTHDLDADPVAVVRTVCAFAGVPDAGAEELSEGRENVASEFLESRVRMRLTGRVRRLPGARTLLAALPRPLKERVYGALRSSPLGRGARAGLTPPPLSPEARARLLARYEPCTRFVEEFTGRALPEWRR